MIKCPYCARLDKDGTPIYRTMGPTGSPPALRCYNVGEGVCRHNRAYPRDQVYREVMRGLLTVLRDPSTVQKYLDVHASEAKAAIKDVTARFEQIGHHIGRLEKEVGQLYSAIAKGGDAWRLNEEIKSRVTAKHEAEAALAALAGKVTEFQLEPASVETYLRLVETINDKLEKSEPIGAEFMEKINSLVDRIFIRPLEGRRGFEVEVFGKLACIVSGTESFSSVFDKGSAIKQMLDGRSLADQTVAEQLKVALFRRQFAPLTMDEAIPQVLAHDMEPVNVGVLTQRLLDIGVRRHENVVKRGCKRAQDRDELVRIRYSGVMLRKNYEKLEIKYFRSTEQILTMCEEVLAQSERPLFSREILDRLAERGMRLAGNARVSLQGALKTCPHRFKSGSGERWFLLPGLPSDLAA